ncbi:MAG: hypothetical protein HYS12_14520 [Planctomycetes bacterium]|nr:hypothetical protein [Planctomycetota bacterium]
MSAPEPSPVPYRVVYSGLVRNSLRNLVVRAAARSRSSEVLAAAREIDRRLKIYPQFGETLRDLHTVGETVWHAAVPPLHVFYIIDDPNRAVFVVEPFEFLPHSGLS